MSDRTVTLGQFLTREELRACDRLWRLHGSIGRGFTDAVLTDIITPNMARINAALGQENDARYLAYMVEYVFVATGKLR